MTVYAVGEKLQKRVICNCMLPRELTTTSQVDSRNFPHDNALYNYLWAHYIVAIACHGSVRSLFSACLYNDSTGVSCDSIVSSDHSVSSDSSVLSVSSDNSVLDPVTKMSSVFPVSITAVFSVTTLFSLQCFQ